MTPCNLVDGDEWSASRPGCFTAGKEPPVPDTGVAPRSLSGPCGEVKLCYQCRESNPDSSVVQDFKHVKKRVLIRGSFIPHWLKLSSNVQTSDKLKCHQLTKQTGGLCSEWYTGCPEGCLTEIVLTFQGNPTLFTSKCKLSKYTGHTTAGRDKWYRNRSVTTCCK
jgi:hypothetical protein